MSSPTEASRLRNLARIKHRYDTDPDFKAAVKARANAWEKANRPARLKIEHRARDRHTEQYLLSSSRQNARKRNLPHTITKTDIFIPEFCPVLKTPFQFNTPFAPSLDRVDNSKGYIPGNLQVISRKANMMKHNATNEELRLFAEWILS